MREDGDGGVSLLDGDALVAEGRSTDTLDVRPPVRPWFEAAVAASSRHPWRGMRHDLSDCFVCGVERADGLGVSPGPLAGADGVMSAPFAPDASVAENGLVRPEVVWAALDCPSYPPAPLGARAGRPPRPDGGVPRARASCGRDPGRRRLVARDGWAQTRSASALVDANGEVVAGARATWIELAAPARE